MAGNSDEKPKRRRGPGRPFKPGESGNPNGRPPAILSKALLKALGGRYNDKLDNLTALVEAIVKDAIDGDKEMRQLIFDRIEGKTPLSIEGDAAPIVFTLKLGDGDAK